MTMPKFLIERELPGAGGLSAAELQAISRKSCDVLQALGPDIQWIQSYVTDDKIYCVYIAPDVDIIREHARCGGFPANCISEVRSGIDPTTAEGEPRRAGGSPALRSALLLLASAFIACADQPLPTGPVATGPSFEIADAARAYKTGFYWLPPVSTAPAYTGTFDPELSPTVEICELASGACAAVVAAYSMTDGPGGEVVRLDADDERYHVNWHTNEFDLSPTGLYRISVRAGIQNVLLGYADVQPVSNGSGLKNVDTQEYIGLVDGRTLPIKFRIQTGIVGQVEVEPAEAEATPGTTKQFVAVPSDLHGQPIVADVAWASSVEGVATVDAMGLATALADGVTTITATSERIVGSATLTVEGGTILVGSGRLHACALTADGRAYCWGSNGPALGAGTTLGRVTPVAVLGGHSFATIDAGEGFTCAVTTAGRGYCWGSSAFGRLGIGSAPTFQTTPAPIAPASPFNVEVVFAAISTGANHACGISTAGQAYCWGANGSGELGDEVMHLRSVPFPVAGGHTFATISAGEQHTCAVTTAGTGYCWGEGTDGRLGNGSTIDRSVPTPVAGELRFASISAGLNFSCGLTTAGAAYCWGEGANGRLGSGSTADHVVPVAVAGDLAFASISAGANFACAVTPAGQGYCWGIGQLGRLGNGSTSDQWTPTLVAGGLSFTSISAGFSFACGVSAEPWTYCWGSSSALGNGTFGNQLVPTPIAPLP
jgi:alpha-tubulin suppressor-like RCC1 family protein